MAKQANRMMIGVFVVIAVILMAASLVVFGSGKFFKKTQKYVLYFDGSVKGLSVGAPLLFQGVQVGSVISIVIQADLVKLQAQIPVIIEIEVDKFQVGEEGRKMPREPRKNMARLIEKGFRAVLTTQSFITGQLAIELDFYPGSPVNLKNINKEYIEIPTIPSTTERLAQTLEKLDLQGLKKNLESTLAGVDRLVNNPDLSVSIQALKDTLQEARKLVNSVDRKVDPLAGDVKKVVKDFSKLTREVDARVGPVATGLDKTMSAARGVISEDSPMIVELQNTLKEISTMARSFRQLSDYLEQHPEALIRGKGNPGGK